MKVTAPKPRSFSQTTKAPSMGKLPSSSRPAPQPMKMGSMAPRSGCCGK